MTDATERPPAARPDGSAAAATALRTDVGALAARLRERVGEVSVIGRTETVVTSIEFDHRRIEPSSGELAGGDLGPLFCCLPGEHHDGHEYAAEARRSGAVAFICERDLGEAAAGAAQLVVALGRAREAMAHASCLFFKDPTSALETIGVTGTNGKTTTTYLLSSILAAGGYLPYLVGTLSGTRTTPESPELQRHFYAAVLAGKEAGRPAAVALEASSHAIVQHRVDGYVHDVAVFTNLSQDHLDYHQTMEAYFAAKATLFTPEHARCGVVNAGDEYGRRLLEISPIPLEPFSIEDAEGLEVGPRGSTFQLRGERVQLFLLGRLNVENALAAAAAARALGIDDATIARGLAAAEPVPGRFEQVGNRLGLTVVVDYAHTPAGLGQACTTLRGLLSPGGRLLVVFGAGGDRDHDKRPLMGRVVAAGADLAIVTTDNPRHERPEDIISEVVDRWPGPAELRVEPDRRRAVALGLSLARRGDIVLVAGKGHETTQQVGDSLVDFDDRSVVVEESERLAGAA